MACVASFVIVILKNLLMLPRFPGLIRVQNPQAKSELERKAGSSSFSIQFVSHSILASLSRLARLIRYITPDSALTPIVKCASVTCGRDFSLGEERDRGITYPISYTIHDIVLL